MPGFDLITSIREIEAARDDIVHPSFVGTLFDGQPNFELVFPFPRQAEADKRLGDAVCANVAQFPTRPRGPRRYRTHWEHSPRCSRRTGDS